MVAHNTMVLLFLLRSPNQGVMSKFEIFNSSSALHQEGFLLVAVIVVVVSEEALCVRSG